MTLFFKWIEAPFGQLKLVGGNAGLAAILWENESAQRVRLGPMIDDGDHAVLIQAEQQLGEYFGRVREVFDIPLAFSGTAFQIQVWHALLTIPYGQTRSYREIAAQIGYPAAVRAVGAANGRNPLSIIAPCHRVVGSSGALTGFAGGLEIKRYLLDLEAGSLFPQQPSGPSSTRP